MSDGGLDENPRYEKVIMHAIDHFKTYNLDAVFVITNAPGQSAFNRVERRMAPLSRELAGLLLPHDHFGSHLNSSAATIDTNLEEKNFEFAGQTLAEVWSKLMIDKYPVHAEYIGAQSVARETEKVPPAWYDLHVHESQYFLQVYNIIIIQVMNHFCTQRFLLTVNVYLFYNFRSSSVII